MMLEDGVESYYWKITSREEKVRGHYSCSYITLSHVVRMLLHLFQWLLCRSCPGHMSCSEQRAFVRPGRIYLVVNLVYRIYYRESWRAELILYTRDVLNRLGL
jgi:hypothetical protein